MPGDGSIQCYNGVMLCNRPVFRPSQVPNINRNSHNKGNAINHEKKDAGGSGSKGNSFVCGTLSKPWGMNVKIPEKSRVLSRLSRTDGALSRHKLWLREMQEKKEKDAKQIQEEKIMKDRKLKEFMKRQAKLRAKARSEKEEKIDEATLEQEQSEEENSNSNRNIAGEKRCRPAWSLTESNAQNVRDESHAREEEELMNYVDDLDFESYYDDLELSVLMSQVKERIKTLEKEKKKDESKLKATIEVRMISD